MWIESGKKLLEKRHCHRDYNRRECGYDNQQKIISKQFFRDSRTSARWNYIVIILCKHYILYRYNTPIFITYNTSYTFERALKTHLLLETFTSPTRFSCKLYAMHLFERIYSVYVYTIMVQPVVVSMANSIVHAYYHRDVRAYRRINRRVYTDVCARKQPVW